MNKNFTVKNTMYISLKVIILFLFFITQGYAKNLPPGSGEGDLPANVLILLDKSGSMSARSGSTGVDSRRPYRLAVGSTSVDGGRNVFLNSRWGSYDKRNISYDNKLTWKWKKNSPCHYNATTEVAEFYDGHFYFVNNYHKEREFCKVNQTTGKVTKIKTYNKNNYNFKGGDLYDKYLYLFSYNWSSPKIIIWDLSTEKSKECSYSSGWGTKDLGQTMTSWYFYSNGTPEINRAGTYMMAYGYDWWDTNKRGFYKYNITPGLNCPDKSNDQFIKYNYTSNGQIKHIESASTNDDYFYVANYSKHKIQRFDVSGSTITSSEIKEIGKNGKVDASYSPTSDSEVKFKNPYSIAVDSSNNRIYVADYNNNVIQVLSEENDGFEWVRNVGGRINQTRMTGAHQAIKSITTDANLTSGVHFGFAYWSSAATVWVYWNYNKYPKCRSIKSTLMTKYGVSSNHWWFSNANYTCRDRGGALPGYTGWDTTKNYDAIDKKYWGQGIPCDNDNCLKVRVNKEGAPRVAKEVVKVTPGGGTDAKVFTDIALQYFKHADSPRDPSYSCQVNYIIVIGDGVWGNHAAGLKNVKTLKNTYGVKTITIAYGGGIRSSGKANFREFAKAGGTADVIIADDPATLKSTLSAEINRILAERVSFTAPAITATIEEGGSLMQAQFKYVQNQEWRGTLKKTKLKEDGSVAKDSKGNPVVLWEADKVMPNPSERKIWSVVPGTDYTTDLNNIVTSNRDDILDMFTLFGSEINNYHRVTPKVAGSVSNTRCKSASLFGPTNAVLDSTTDDAEGLITFLRGLDYFDYDGDCNLTEIRKDTDGNKTYLGDIYHSEMITVGKPNAETKYSSQKEEAYWRALNNYDAWAAAGKLQNRKDIVYVGANDGMLHAIDFKTGVEKWAFIPPFILPKLPNIINESYNDDNKKGGSNAIFGVDGSPVQHDIYFKSPFDTAAKWNTVLIVPYGRGGNGFSAIIVTDPDKPRHLFSIYNDIINNKVHVMKHDGSTLGPFEYIAKSYLLSDTTEALAVTDVYEDDKTGSDKTCNDTLLTTCYLEYEWTWENFPGNGMTAADFTIVVNDKTLSNVTVTNTNNTLTLRFPTSINYQADPDRTAGADQVAIYVNQASAATGVQSPNEDYDYSELGETWSAPRVIRIPNLGPSDNNIYDDLYVAVMGAGYGANYPGVGSGVYVINLTDTERPGKLEKFIDIKDTPANGINNSVPGDAVVINRDSAKGYVSYGGAIVYVNDLEGKITKINLTDLIEPNLKLYDHYTMFDVKSTSSDGRLMYHSMDAAIGKDTKQLWLFAGTGDYNNLTDTTSVGGNILLGIADETFPEFKTPIDIQNFNSGATMVPPTIDDLSTCLDTTKVTVLSSSIKCPKNMGAGISPKEGWVIYLDNHKKVTSSPTVSGGIAYFPVFSPPISGDKCRNGAATICAVDDECGTNASSLLGTHAKSDKCLYVGEGILSKIVTYGGKIYANIAGKSDTGSDLIEKDSIGMEVDITRGTWKENF